MTVNTLDNHQEQERSAHTVGELLLRLLPIGLSVFCLSALVYYHLRHADLHANSVLQVLIAGIYDIFGLAPSVLCCLLVLTWSSIWFVTGRLDRPWSRLGRLLAMTVMLGVFLNLGDGGVTPAPHKGQLGEWLARHLYGLIGYLPSIVLVWAITFASLLLATDFFFSDSFERLRRRHAPDADRESGVEQAVTDHLRGLATPPSAPVNRNVPPAPAAPAISAALAAAAIDEIGDDIPDPLSDEALSQAATQAVAEAPAAEVEPPAPRRRLSYFERRQLEEEEAARRAAVEASPDARELDTLLREPLASSAAAVEADVPGAPAVADEAPTRAQPLDWVSLDDEVDEVDEDADEADAAEPVEDDDDDVADDVQDELDGEAEGDEVDDDAEDDDAEDDDAEDDDAADDDAADGVAAADLAAFENDDADDDAAPEIAETASEEPVVAIPRPPAREPARQQNLFAPGIDENLIQEAAEVVVGAGRASATLLQRKLRVDYDTACDLLAALAKRGVVDLGADANHGRIVG